MNSSNVSTVGTLAVRISPADRERLEKLAQATGRSVEDLAAEAIEDSLAFDDELIASVEKAVASIERGEGVPHETVKEWAASLGTNAPLPMPGRRRG